MDILWDETKSRKLKEMRGVSFEDVAQLILEKRFLAILENPSHPDQMVFIVKFKDYTYVIPFVLDKDDNIILKTIFPSRKFHKLYGEEKP